MKARFILVVSAIVLLIFGLGFIISPQWTMELFDITVEPGGILMTQLLGAGFVGFAILNWMARNVTVYEDASPTLWANFFMNAIGFVVALLQRLDGLGNAWSWVPVALYLLFALAFGYCILVRSSIEKPMMRTRHA